jgi:prophage DNA circulation protein
VRFWAKTQAQASFKGVNFFVDTDRLEGGRRLITHEYPGSEDWDNEDLGRLSQGFLVEAFVAGDDADDQAKSLWEACNTLGPGQLQLPLRTAGQARVRRVSSTFLADKMGRINFAIEFVLETSKPAGIRVSTVQDAGAVSLSAETATQQLTDAFSEKFNSAYASIGGQPFAVPAVARVAASVTIGLSSSALLAAFAGVNILDQNVAAKVQYGARLLGANAERYAEQGPNAYRIDQTVFVDDQDSTDSAFARVFGDTLRLMTLNADDPATVVRALDPLITFEAQDPSSSINTLSVQAEASLTGTVAAFVRRASLVRWAQALTRITYKSRAEAVTARALIAPAFYDELYAATDPDGHAVLMGIRNAAADYLTRNGAQLPRSLRLKVGRGRPAAVVAAELYNDASRDAELWAENDASCHPLTLPDEIDALAA